jgi:hypothetical protein
MMSRILGQPRVRSLDDPVVAAGNWKRSIARLSCRCIDQRPEQLRNGGAQRVERTLDLLFDLSLYGRNARSLERSQ